jgi:hypothetical protein
MNEAIRWPCRADDPVQRAEYARVTRGLEAAAYEYNLGRQLWQEMIDALPEPVRRTIAADPYDQPVVTWDEVVPYVPSAREAASEWGSLWSPVAADFLARIDVWFGAADDFGRKV